MHNGRFVMKLRAAAARCPTVTLVQGNVIKLLQRPLTSTGRDNPTSRITGVVYRDEKSNEIRLRAPLTVVCDGCLSVFRQPLCNANLILRSKFMGLILRDCRLPFPKCGHVVLARPSPILIYPISATETRMLIDFPQPIPSDEELVDYLHQQVCPQLPTTIHDSFRNAVRDAAAGERSHAGFMSMPNQCMAVEPANIPGVLLLGDSFNMRHPLTGGGMTVGLTDVSILKQIFQNVRRFDDLQAVHSGVMTFYNTRRARCGVVNVLADALYQVFSDPILKEACWHYLALGGEFSAGPVSLLSGINKSVWTLICHFYAVALYATWRIGFRPFPTPRKLYIAGRSLRVASKIIVPLLQQEYAHRRVPFAFLAAVRWLLWF